MKSNKDNILIGVKFTKLEEVIPLFDNIKCLPGKNSITYLRSKFKKTGEFNGITIENKYRYCLTPHNDKIEHLYFSRDKIIDEISLKTNLLKNEVEKLYSKKIEEKYNYFHSIYLNKLIQKNIYFNDIYKSILIEGYRTNLVDQELFNNGFIFDKNDPELFCDTLGIVESKHIHSVRFYENDNPLINRITKNDYEYSRFYNKLTRSVYYLYNVNNYYYKQLLNKDNNNDLAIEFRDLISIGKINVKIYDHLGNLHQYKEYHKIINI